MTSSSRTVLLLIGLFAALAVAFLAMAGGRGRATALSSTGCAPARPHDAGSFAEGVDTPDGPRSYRLHIPPSYDGTVAVPLILSLAGYAESAAVHEYLAGLSSLSDSPDGGFIVLYLEGIASPDIPTAHWNAWQLASPEADDVAFVKDMIDWLSAQLCIDNARVYAQGFSNGAMMAVRLACDLPDPIAAIAAWSGLYYPPMSESAFPNPAESCNSERPVPIVAFHGTADTAIPYDGGEGFGGVTYRPIEESLALWAQHNGCVSDSAQTPLSAETRLIVYAGCIDGDTVQLYVVEGAGHGWPPLPADPDTGLRPVDEARQTWEFFQQHAPPVAVTDSPDCPDYTGDGVVNIGDLVFVVAHYRQAKPGGGVFLVSDVSGVVRQFRQPCPA